MSKDKKTIKPVYRPGVVSNDVENLSNDPFVIKKNEKAKKMVDRFGLPKEFFKKK